MIELTAEHGIREAHMAIKQAIGVHMDMSMYMVCNGVTMDDKKIKMIGKGSLMEAMINCNLSAVIQQVFHTLAKKGGKKGTKQGGKHGSELRRRKHGRGDVRTTGSGLEAVRWRFTASVLREAHIETGRPAAQSTTTCREEPTRQQTKRIITISQPSTISLFR